MIPIKYCRSLGDLDDGGAWIVSYIAPVGSDVGIW